MHDAPRAHPPNPDPRHHPIHDAGTAHRTATVVRMPMDTPDAVMIFTREDGTCVLVADTHSDSEHIDRVRQAAAVLATLPHPRPPW